VGSLRKLDLKVSRCNVFVETGTGTGGTLRHAYINGGFKKLFSIEACEETAQAAQKMFRNCKTVEIVNDTSEAALHKILPELQNEKSVLFFLDAHFVGEISASYGGYQSNVADSVNLPLQNELQLIHDYRANSSDIIIVDDLRIYEDGPYAKGNLPPNFANIPAERRNIDFVYGIFGNRKIVRNFDDEGYLLVLPQDSEFALTKLRAPQRIWGKLLEELFLLGIKI
jgi:hypothetical protein